MSQSDLDRLMNLYHEVVKKRRIQGPIVLRVYQGGRNAYQVYSICEAMSELKLKYNNLTVETLITDDMKAMRFTEEDFVNWLLDSDIHLIHTHIHQGIDMLNFDMNELKKQLRRLSHHPGFPNGIYLTCPVFTQDKYNYLKILMENGSCNPTLKIDFNRSHNYDDIFETIIRLVI